MNVSAVLTAPVDMQAILDGRQWLYLAPEKVRECDGPADCTLDGHRRSVPVVPPAPVTCPECDGEGMIPTGAYAENGEPYFEFCERCDGGDGTVPAPLLLCAEQVRHVYENGGDPYPFAWHVPDDTCNAEGGTDERRTAGLVLVPQPTYLPVVEIERFGPAVPYARIEVVSASYIREHYFGDPWPNCKPSERMWLHRQRIDLPAVPGAVLVTWDRADILDPPIVTRRCPGCGGRPWMCDGKGNLPLSVGTGFTEVTLP